MTDESMSRSIGKPNNVLEKVLKEFPSSNAIIIFNGLELGPAVKDKFFTVHGSNHIGRESLIDIIP